MKTGLRGALLCGATTLIAIAGAAGSAHATTVNANVTLLGQPLVNATVTVNTPGVGPANSLEDAFSQSPTALATALACPVAQEIDDQFASIVCALNVLGYAYRTTYVPASGPPQVRYTKAVAGLPTPIDVNGDLLPDFTGTLTPSVTLTGAGASLNISRTPAFPATGKVSVEAVLLNPLAPDSYLGFGEDGRAAGTASNWNATVSAFALSPSDVDLGLAFNVNGAPSTLAALGEVFSGPDADNPQNISRGTVHFTPVPATFTTQVKLSDGRQQAIVSSTVPSRIDADVDLIKPGNEKNVDVTIDKLPSLVDVVHTSSGGHENVTYTANAPIDLLTGTYRDRTGSAINTAARLDVTGVPAHITFDQADGKTIVDAPTGSFGTIEARFAKGDDVPAPGPGSDPYLAFHRFSSAKLTAGLRLKNLKSVAIDQSGPYAGQLIFSAPLGPLPLSAQDEVTGITLTGSLSGLPLNTEVVVDTDNGVVTFDGHGEGIDQIALKATKNSGTFFSRVSRIDATIDDLPPTNTISFAQSAGAVTVAATNPIGTISLLASDGSDAPAVTGSYAWYEDTPSIYRAFVRMAGLKGVSFSANPLSGSLDTAAAQVFNLHGEIGAVTVDGRIDKLPPHIGFSMADGAGGAKVLDYDTQGTPIDKITLDAHGLPLPAGYTDVHAEIDHLPSHMTLTLPASGGTVTFNPHGDHVGRVLAQAYGAAGAKNAVPGHQLLWFSDIAKQITLDLHNIGAFKLRPSPLLLEYDVSHAPLDYGVELADATYFEGTVSNPQPAIISADFGGVGKRLFYNVQSGGPNFTGDGSIDAISLRSNAGGGYIDATVEHVPASLLVCLQSDPGTLCKPGWVPLTLDGHDVPTPDMAVQFIPRTLNQTVPTERLTVNGRVCLSESDPASCLNAVGNPDRIVIDDLRFGTVEFAFGITTGCTISCGRAWGAFNTEDTPITGRVRLYPGSDGDPRIDFNAPDPDSFIKANELIALVHWDADPLDAHLELVSSGTFTCGDPDPSLVVSINNFPDPDLLGGTFGIC